MSSPSAQSTPEPDASAVPSERPSQGEFTEPQQEFLRKYLDEYLAAESSNTKKGSKKRWVKQHVYYKYVEEFKSDGPNGPNLSSLFEVRLFNIHNLSDVTESKM